MVFEYKEKSNSYKKSEPVKTLATGILHHHYRVSTPIDDHGLCVIVRETVLSGYKHQFLDSVEVFLSNGILLSKYYRIRECVYSDDIECSSSHTKRSIHEAFHMSTMINKIDETCVSLYDVDFQQSEDVKFHVGNFIHNIEK